MTRIRSIILLLGLCLAPVKVAAQAQAGDSVVVASALDWLAALDRGEYRRSFEDAAPLLQGMAGSAEGWERFLSQARKALSPPVERQLVLSEPDPELAAAPAGEYWRLTFELLDGGSGTETVVLQLVEGDWRPAMYGIAP